LDYKYPMFPKIIKEEYKEVTEDPNKHVVVAFVTKWCKYCKEVEKMYKDVKKYLNSEITDFIFA